jgi:hypothetical protein
MTTRTYLATFLRLTLDYIFLGDDFKREACVAHNYTLETHATHAPTPRNGHECAVHICAREHLAAGSWCKIYSPCRIVHAEYLAHVAQPQIMQRLVYSVLLLLFGDLVETEFAALGGGERARFLFAVFSVFFFAVGEGTTAEGAGRGGGGCCADGEGPLEDALVVMGGCSVGGEGAFEEDLAEWRRFGVRHAGWVGTWVYEPRGLEQ